MAKGKYCEVECTTFIWKVRYPLFSCECNIFSSSFSIDSFGITRYCLNLISKKNDENYSFSLHLRKHELDCEPNTIAFNLKLSVTGSCTDEHYVLEHVNFINISMTIFENIFLVNEETDEYSKNIMTFHLQIEPDDNYCRIDDLWSCNDQDLEILSSDIAGVLNTKQYSDLTVRSIDDKPVTLHKAIFGIRYPSLAENLDLFQNPKQEYNLGIDFEGICVLLRYLYSGKINLAKSTYGLHEVLRKAGLSHLQHILYPVPRIIHASTVVPIKYGSFYWIIHNFSTLGYNSLLINNFCCDDFLEWTKLRFLFYTRQNADNEECIAFKIQRTEQDKNLYIACKITLVGGEDYRKSYLHNFKSEREFIISSYINVKKIEEQESWFLCDDTLKIRFDITISNLEEVSEYDSVRYLEVNTGQFSTTMNLWAFRNDLARLYLNSRFSDITIQNGSLLIPAHRVILSARSTVFARILQNEIQENATMVIENCDEETVVQILSYVYCGAVNTEAKSFEWANKLYKAAHEYKLLALKQKCASYIETLLDIHNVSAALELANECKDDYFQNNVENFIFDHFYEIFETDNWRILMDKRPHLTQSILLKNLI